MTCNAPLAPVSVNALVSVNVYNNGGYRSRYSKRVYNSGTISVNDDSNGSDLSRYCQRLTGPRSAVGNVSGYRCDTGLSRGREFDPGPVPYFRGD